MKILFTGDVNFGSSVFDEDATAYALKSLKKSFDECDYVIPNLECTLIEKSKYIPIKKSGPNLADKPENISFLKGMNVYGVTLANNHIGDFGEDAVRATLALLRENNITSCGAGKDIQSAYSPIRIEKDEIMLSIISVCENEFGIATEKSYGSAGYNPRRLLRAIRQEKESNRLVIVVFHGGNEHSPIPSPDTVDRYRLICDMGADAVIGGHTYCPQGYEIYDGKPIVYSMGNFLFPKPLEADNSWFFGYMTELEIDTSIKIKAIPYRYDRDNRCFISLSGNKAFNEYIELLSNVIKDEALLKLCFDKWALLHPWCPSLPENYSGGVFDITDYNPYPNYNLICCEAHLSQLKAALKLLCEGVTAITDKRANDILDFDFSAFIK